MDWTLRAKWTYFVKWAELYQELNPLPEALRCEPAIAAAMEALNRFSSDPAIIDLDERQLRFRVDEASRTAQARGKGRLKGLREARLLAESRLVAAGFPPDALSQALGNWPEDLRR